MNNRYLLRYGMLSPVNARFVVEEFVKTVQGGSTPCTDHLIHLADRLDKAIKDADKISQGDGKRIDEKIARAVSKNLGFTQARGRPRKDTLRQFDMKHYPLVNDFLDLKEKLGHNQALLEIQEKYHCDTRTIEKYEKDYKAYVKSYNILQESISTIKEQVIKIRDFSTKVVNREMHGKSTHLVWEINELTLFIKPVNDPQICELSSLLDTDNMTLLGWWFNNSIYASEDSKAPCSFPDPIEQAPTDITLSFLSHLYRLYKYNK